MKKEFLGMFILIFLLLTTTVTALTFIDNSQGDFESGEYNWTFYNSSGFIQLNESRLNGTYTSQIFNAGGTSQWNNISWFTEVPYNQELPDNQEVETGDFLRGMNMTGNVLLMHMNEESGTIVDSSGNGNNGTYNGELYSQEGKLNTAIGFNGNNDFISVDSYSPHYVSGDSFTYSFWFKTSETTRRDLLDIRDTDLSGFPVILITHNWEAEGKISFIARGSDGNLKTITHSNYPINDDSWHLATATVNDGNGVFYIDGGRIGGFTGLDMDMDFSDSNLYLASTEGTDRLFNGVLDEVAIFNRSLSEQEIQDIYKRGVLRLNLSVQNCSSEDCSGSSWNNLGNNLTSPQELNLTNQYFQYKHDFLTDNEAFTPKLYNVSLDYTELLDPIVNISLIYPTSNIDVYKNKFFNFTVNVSCSEANCGEINVTLDPTTDYNKKKELNVTSTSGSPSIAHAIPIKITSGDDSTTGTGEIVLDWTNIDGREDIAVYDENDNLLDYWIESFNATNETAVIHVYKNWTRDGSTQAQIFYGDGTSDESVNSSTVFDKETDLAGGWAFNEESGNASALTSNNNDGTVYGATQGVDGQVDGSYDFDGTDDYVQVANISSLNIEGDISYGVWIKPTVPFTGHEGIIDKGSTSNRQYWMWGIDGQAKVTAQVYGTNINPGGGSGWNLQDGVFHHVFVVGEENGVGKIYVDGSEYASASIGSGFTTTNPLNFGLISGYQKWNGTIDDVRIYNRTLSFDEITAKYNSSKSTPDFFSQTAAVTTIEEEKGIIPTGSGTPFYTNATSNPLNISLNAGESQLVTFWVNATGEYDSVHEFFAFANITSNMSISSTTERLNITIISNPINITSHAENPESPTNYVGQYQFNITVYDYDGDYDSILFSWNGGANETITTYENVSGGREYYYDLETPITGNDIPFVWFVNDTEGNSDSYSGTYTILSPQTPADLSLDKIVSLQELNSTHITYNITLKTTNKGGSKADSVILTDTDSESSPYDLGTISEGNTSTNSYLKSYERNSTTYNSTFAIATVNGTDHYEGGYLEANSSEITVTVPSTTADTLLTLVKNVYYNSENSTSVNYTVSLEVVNSGGMDLTSISVIDTDLDINENIDLNRTQKWNYSDVILIDKAASNTNKLFAKSSATTNTITYQSNQIQVRIPGYGGPADAIVYAPDSVKTSTSFDSTITVLNMNPDIGQDFTVDYWITNEAETTNYSSGQQTIYVAASGSSNLTATLTSPSSAGNYKLKTIVSWEGDTAPAFDAFVVTTSDSNTGDIGTGGGSYGGGGSITGREATEEIVCNPPYIRYGTECCLDSNNNSICDNDEVSKSPEETETAQENQTEEEIEKPEKQSQFKEDLNAFVKKTGEFFSSTMNQISKNRVYFFIGFGALLLVSLIFLTLKFLIKRKPKDIVRLKSIKGIEVYGADGHKIGKVTEIHLEEKKSKLYGWLIKVDKNTAKKIKKKNIIVRQKHVKSIKHIMILHKRISKHLEKLESKD